MLSEIDSLVVLRAELCVAVRSNDEGLVGNQQSGIVWTALFALKQINALTQFESFSFFEDLKGKHR